MTFDVFESHFSFRSGDVFPEGGSVEVKSIDLCQKCNEEFLVLLKESGYYINTAEEDY